MAQLVQVLASMLILVAFVLAQRGSLSQASRGYLVLNLAGSSVLAVLAAHERQLGFLLLEASWAAVSLMSLLRRREPGGDAGLSLQQVPFAEHRCRARR